MHAPQTYSDVAPGSPAAPSLVVVDGETVLAPSNETHQPVPARAEGSLLRRMRERLAQRLGRKLGAAQAPNVYPLF